DARQRARDAIRDEPQRTLRRKRRRDHLRPGERREARHGADGNEHVELWVERAQPCQCLLEPGDVLLECEEASVELPGIFRWTPSPRQTRAAVDPPFALAEREDEHARL